MIGERKGARVHADAGLGGGDVTQNRKLRPHNLSSVTRIHIVERENQLLKVVL